MHPWDLTRDEAVRVQARLRERLVLAWDGRAVSTVGGVDVGFRREQAIAAIVVFTFPELTPLANALGQVPVTFPYIPGLLAFREGPAVLAAWERLRMRPDLILFDAQGIAHPRGIGLASHMGLWLERPSIGVAKSRLYGRGDPPGPNPGDRAMLRDERDPQHVIGAVVRTQQKERPLYVSPGHLIDVPASVDFVLACTAGSRLPEPTHWAHRVASGEAFPIQIGEQGRLL
jgi:deoxyribonuclease V